MALQNAKAEPLEVPAAHGHRVYKEPGLKAGGNLSSIHTADYDMAGVIHFIKSPTRTGADSNRNYRINIQAAAFTTEQSSINANHLPYKESTLLCGGRNYRLTL